MRALTTNKLAVSVLALGASTAAVVFGSWAAWTAQTTNPGNQVTAGRLTLGNDKAAAPILTTNVTAARPGSTGSDTVKITNAGTVPMAVRLSQSSVTDQLSDGNNVLKLTIHDADRNVCLYPAGAGACPTLDSTTAGAAWNGGTTLANLAVPGTGGANWAAGEEHVFTVTWKYTDDGVANNANNVAAARTARFDLAWNGTPA